MDDKSFYQGTGNAKLVKIPRNKRQRILHLSKKEVDDAPKIHQTEIRYVGCGLDYADSPEIATFEIGIKGEDNITQNERSTPTRDTKSSNVDEDAVVASYTNWDVFINIVSILFYIFDFATDSLLAASYYREKRFSFFGLTLAFMTIPSLVVNICSFFWYLDDYKSYRNKQNRQFGPNWISLSVLHALFSIFQLGPVLRYASAIHYGLKSRKADHSRKKEYYYLLSLEEDKDSCMLRLFEAALEAGPQLILQLFVLLTQAPEFKDSIQMILQVSAIITSWFGMSWAHVAYHRALRFSRDDKENMSIIGTFLYLLWRLFEMGPRVIALAAFAEVHYTWVFVITGIHWIIMTCWYGFQRIYEKPMFGVEWRYLDHAFNMVCAAVAIFGFLNVKEGHTRYRCIIYYFLYYSENVVMICIWFGLTTNTGKWFYLPAFFVVILGFYVCIGFQVVYYIFYHPSMKIHCCIAKEQFFQSVCFTPKILSRTKKRTNVGGLLNTSVELVAYKPRDKIQTTV